MNELDLMDSSKNDYQLVTELSKIVRSYKDKNKPVDKDFVYKVANVCLINNEVDLKNGLIIVGNSKEIENDYEQVIKKLSAQQKKELAKFILSLK